MRITFIKSISDICPQMWNSLWETRYPFTQHGFLESLEASKSCSKESGWEPMHCVGYQDEKLVFAMPLYLKTHSYGEYVFDWSWADAYHRSGLEYYPKLVNAIPFTPATGPRWASKMPLSHDQYKVILSRLTHQASIFNVSGFHSLFPSQTSQNLFSPNTFTKRHACQFHWFNQGYENLDDFLQTFSSRKRKNIRKERDKCKDIHIQFYHGDEATEEDWHLFYTLYHHTYLKRSGRPGYLGKTFFTRLAKILGDQIILVLAEKNEEKVAGAVYFKDDECLYGRYWGAMEEIDGLHFETCYYQGIEYAIKYQLKRFDPGAQGEHKIQRGFQAIRTCSYHHLYDNRFHNAVASFCEEESKETTNYIEHARSLLPFKEGVDLIDSEILFK